MKDLHSILKAVSRGTMEIAKAETLIQELFEASVLRQGSEDEGKARRSRDKAQRTPETENAKARKVTDSAFSGLGGKIGFEAFLKKSRELGRKVDFRPSHEGFDAKLSIFNTVEVSPDTTVEGNAISGSQWKSVAFHDTAEVRRNHFTISQVSRFNCQRSNFSVNEFGLTRMADVTIQESRFEDNRLSRSMLTDFSMSEADFTHNRMLRSEMAGVVLNASRITNSVFSSSRWTECEFDQSDLQGLRFEDCSFTECRFANCEIVATDSAPFSGLHVRGMTFEGLRSAEDLISALETKPQQEHNPARSGTQQGRDVHPRRKIRSRRH
ncbi:MAG: hypothetical protein RL189_2941 [Pseudomonadota bacterium]|jgi:uncharacterized protein YjbI with pentapeptide repeats